MTESPCPFRPAATHLETLLNSTRTVKEVEHVLHETQVNGLARAAYIAEVGGNRYQERN